MHNKTRKKALLVVHQSRSSYGDVGIKLKERNFTLDIRRPTLGDKLPSDMHNYDLSVIYGGPMSANDQDTYIKYEIDWISNALESNKPFLGICLGAQMLAKQLGAQVLPSNDKSCEIGFFKIDPVNEGLKIFQNQKIFFQWHNEGFELPNGATLLAKGSKFPNQAFQYQNAFGIQFHPEVNLRMHLMWLYFASYRLKDKGAQSRKHQLTQRIKYGKSINMWLDNFLDNHLLRV